MNLIAWILFTAAAVSLLRTTQKLGEETRSRFVTVGSNPFFRFGSEPVNFDTLYEAAGGQFGINPRLLKAIAIQESGEAPNAVNPRDPSYGLMQVLCVDDGQGGCGNKLNVRGWPPESRERLFDPGYNIGIAAQILQWNLDQYGFPKGIAVYNAWSARHDPSDGPYRNQNYVDSVLANFSRLGNGHHRDGSARIDSTL